MFACGGVALGDGPRIASSPNRFRVRLGLEVEAAGGPCTKIRCGFPTPMNWPEQEVVLRKTEARGDVKGLKIGEPIAGGVRQASFYIPRLAKGEKAAVICEFEIARRAIDVPAEPEVLTRPSNVDRRLRIYLGASPFIETSHDIVKAEAESLDLTGFANDWERVRAIREHTFQRVKYTGVRALQGALRGLQEGGGDCEERTSVFVALCRLNGIPARSVWIPEHAYAEFYLEDSQGTGHWFPCESVGGRLGQQGDDYLILQKGDRFRDPLRRGDQRYLSESANGVLGRAGAAPTLRAIRLRWSDDDWVPIQSYARRDQ